MPLPVVGMIWKGSRFLGGIVGITGSGYGDLVLVIHFFVVALGRGREILDLLVLMIHLCTVILRRGRGDLDLLVLVVLLCIVGRADDLDLLVLVAVFFLVITRGGRGELDLLLFVVSLSACAGENLLSIGEAGDQRLVQRRLCQVKEKTCQVFKRITVSISI